ncbi:maltokinase N-terminal cap-like domain-containing protein [Cellulomonas oligotrophica]|uniref:Maltokinase n=1 Tax=Cellulomonas oligotrophica TaxID=931536 RepID=A0A7Y9FI70_9CELL|nr:phosphotransferase [Cellulomonas oligotrophica]NYD87658.1 maltokinase [Cellulomonas oligotrophica]GIG33137.1 hypothetical protein Col01nite_22960 [Cellulomonas oligotrophica]
MTLDARAPDDRDRQVLDLLRGWLPGRRWYPAKGATAELTLVGTVALPAGPAGAAAHGRTDGAGSEVRVLLVRAHAGSVDVVLQVPVVLERALPVQAATGPDAATADGADDAVVGRVAGVVVRDGAGDPRFLRAWLAAAEGPGADVDVDAARVVTGEQSNTSVVLPGTDGAPAGILKVLRTVAAGENPDIDVPRHLVDAGWDGVPAPLAWATARWTAPDGTRAAGYLGVLSAFVPGARDGFELACEAARTGTDLGALAHELGATVAGMHAALVGAYGTDEAADATAGAPSAGPATGPAAVAQALTTRLAWATAAVPGLAARAAGVREVVARVAALASTPPRQRVHGDLHLGQVLRSGDRWFVIDFEGEPLAPLDARTRPDLALRDVAGLLRSFDYAAAVGGLGGAAADAWTASARAGLLRGYGVQDDPAQALLLRALELDKTLYEVVYEARNRPAWAPIPQAGLDRLLA